MIVELKSQHMGGLEEIRADIVAMKKESEGLLDEIIGEVGE